MRMDPWMRDLAAGVLGFIVLFIFLVGLPLFIARGLAYILAMAGFMLFMSGIGVYLGRIAA